MYFLTLVIFISILHVAVFEDSFSQESVSKRKKRNGECACGQQPDFVLSARIVGGTETSPHDYPWVVAMLTDGLDLPCGGILITDKHVLTAAHCFIGNDFASKTILLGAQFLKGEKDVQSRKLSNAIIHEDYSTQDGMIYNDIAIAELDKPVQFNEFISPVCLPNWNQEFERKVATVVGWGKVRYDEDAPSNTLREAKVSILSANDCRKTRLNKRVLPDSMICTYNNGQHTCQGDSGGPLLIYDHKQSGFVTVGIVSWGFHCSVDDVPGFYTKVSHYVDWIKINTKNGNYC